MSRTAYTNSAESEATTEIPSPEVVLRPADDQAMKRRRGTVPGTEHLYLRQVVPDNTFRTSLPEEWLSG